MGLQAFDVIRHLMTAWIPEGRPKAAEVESPNQNKATHTSRMGLAMLIN